MMMRSDLGQAATQAGCVLLLYPKVFIIAPNTRTDQEGKPDVMTLPRQRWFFTAVFDQLNFFAVLQTGLRFRLAPTTIVGLMVLRA